MPRIARVVIPECPHHIIFRGHRRQVIFFCDADRVLLLNILKKSGEKNGIEYITYCLMDNHVHLIAIPKYKESFAKAFGEGIRKYAITINIREDWKGHLFQGRYDSFPMDDKHLYSAVRYVERNPVRAGIVGNAEDYAWSSARPHLLQSPDPFLSDIGPYLKIDDWRSYLKKKEDQDTLECFRLHSRTGRPLGDDQFLSRLEALTGRIFKPQPRGRKRKKLGK
jgi:putative transposase